MNNYDRLRYAALKCWDWLEEAGYASDPKIKEPSHESRSVSRLAKHLFRAFEIMYEDKNLPAEVWQMVETEIGCTAGENHG